MKKIKTILILFVILAVVAFIYFVTNINKPMGRGDAVVLFNIESGDGTSKIIRNLAEKDLVQKPLLFKAYIFITKSQSKLIAGQHALNGQMNMSEMVAELKSKPKNEKQITIIEGWNAAEIGKYLEDQNLVTKADFLKAIKIESWRQDYDFLKNAKGDTLEGFLFPDTYRVFLNASASDIVKKMLDNLDAKLTNDMKGDIASQNKSIFDIMTLASIIEKEVMSDNDKKIVADIFWKRLDIGMALQSDATVNYITGSGRSRSTASDLEIDSPYNTYKYGGLPPGPISNPGLASIVAAIYPQTNSYYFFITDSKGRAIFSKDFEEHKQNIQKYLE